MKNILCIDGGGIRGLAAAVICKKIGESINTEFCSKFDLIAGTSTGGIIALALANRISLDKIVDIYQKHGVNIFGKPKKLWFEKFYPKYSNKNLESLLKDTFSSKRMSDCHTHTFVTSYNLKLRSPYIFMSWGIPESEKGKAQDHSLVSAALATSAAPTYFSPHLTDDNNPMIDGGIYCNNPALLAYARAIELWPNEKINILSIGTGNSDSSILHSDAKEWGELKWIRPLIDCVFSGIASSTDDILGTISDLQVHNLSYLRLQFKTDKTCEQLDSVEEESLQNLERLALSLFKEKEKDIIDFFENCAVNSHKDESSQLDETSKYRNLRTKSIVLRELQQSLIPVEGIEIKANFTINDLIWKCNLQKNRTKFSSDQIRELVEKARAKAFTLKYAKPDKTEDEKLLSDEVLLNLKLQKWHVYLNKILVKRNIDINHSDIIDVGSGNAAAYREFYEKSKSLLLTDISSEALDYAKQNLPNASHEVLSAENLLSVGSSSKDFYLSFRVYQSSLFDVKSALKEVYRVLRIDGKFIISIPIMFIKKDKTPSIGLLESGQDTPNFKYAQSTTEHILHYAEIIGFRDVEIDKSSPYELYIIGQK